MSEDGGQNKVERLEVGQDEAFANIDYLHSELEQVKRNQVLIYAMAVIGFWYFCYKAGGKLGELSRQVS